MKPQRLIDEDDGEAFESEIAVDVHAVVSEAASGAPAPVARKDSWSGSSPSSPSNEDGSKYYHIDPQIFSKYKKTIEEVDKEKKEVRDFYEQQNEIIDSFVDENFGAESAETADENDHKVKIAINGSLAINVVLFCLQISVALSTMSLSLISTSVDAFMDLLSGAILFWTAIHQKRKDLFNYPVGKKRMEPVGIIIFAALMSTVSIQLVMEGLKGLSAGENNAEMNTFSFVIMPMVIIIKGCMYLYCRALTHSSSAVALAQDHLNDISVNGFGFILAILGTHVPALWFADPLGALVVAFLILRSWVETAKEQMELLVGKSASPQFLQRITFLAANHHPDVTKVDTVRAFYMGNGIAVEVDVVLPEDMPLKLTHDICEALQIKIEKLPDVERCWIHADYEFEHRPEHKVE